MRIIAIGRPTHLAFRRGTACGLTGTTFLTNDDIREVNCIRCRKTRLGKTMLAFERVNEVRGYRTYPTK